MSNRARALGALEYRLASLVHWQPRERAVMQALDELRRLQSRRAARVLDIGCGPGLLASAVAERGIRYVGIDPQPAFIDRCRSRNTNAQVSFHTGSVGALPVDVAADDVIVLNGVAHHLDDAHLRLALADAANGLALIICDHWRIEGQVGRLARWLQAADRGKFVRSFDRFEHLPGFKLRSRQVFTIGLGPLPLWPYFCVAYTPE